MKSPFPGMDPYLETHWRDVHHSFLTYARDDMQTQLPRNLRARLEERVCVEPEMGDLRGIYPDLRVVEYPRRSTGGTVSETSADSNVAVCEPFVVDSAPEEVTEGYIEVIDVGSGNRVVTVLELLSLTNKLAGEGRDKYVQKQRELLRAGVNLVEIDLLRAGKRVMAVPADLVPLTRRTAYQVCVTRGNKPSRHEVYPCPLRAPLPTIRIPLRLEDADVTLNLQSLIDRCYHNGRYDDLDYRHPPSPPLEPEDAAWANALLAAHNAT